MSTVRGRIPRDPQVSVSCWRPRNRSSLRILCASSLVGAFALSLAPSGARAADPPSPLAVVSSFLDPDRIALSYAVNSSAGAFSLLGPAGLQLSAGAPEDHEPAAYRPEPLVLAPPQGLALIPTARKIAGQRFDQSTRFQATETGLAGDVIKVRRRLLLDVNTFSSGDSTETWHGLDQLDVRDRGRTLRLADGRVLGDVTLGVGTDTSQSNVAGWMAGEAGLTSLNPFRDVSAQIDLTILEEGGTSDPSLLVLRLRGAYVGAIDLGEEASTAGDGRSNGSEIGLSLGVRW